MKRPRVEAQARLGCRVSELVIPNQCFLVVFVVRIRIIPWVPPVCTKKYLDIRLGLRPHGVEKGLVRDVSQIKFARRILNFPQ